MNGKCFVDTNVLMYAHDAAAGWKQTVAQELIARLWAAGTGVLSTQVLQELCVSVRRRTTSSSPLNEARRVIEVYLSWQIVINTPASIVEALRLESRYRISFWDALIVQAAEQGGAAILYSEDLSNGQKYGSVRVVNPFARSSS